MADLDERRLRLRNAVLQWLYAELLAGRSKSAPTPQTIMRYPGCSISDVGWDELSDAVDNLDRVGYVRRGPRAGRRIAQLALTTEGQLAAQSFGGQQVRDATEAAARNDPHIVMGRDGTVNIVHNSAHAIVGGGNGQAPDEHNRRMLIIGLAGLLVAAISAGVAIIRWAPWDGKSDTAPPAGPVTTQSLPTTQSPVTTTSPTTTGPRETWYNLVEYTASGGGNGFNTVNSIRIGVPTRTFPGSIVGYYQSSLSEQNDRATWTVGGRCTKLSVWVGKDADSSSSAGVGRFYVRGDDADLAAPVEKSMTDAPEEITADISGVGRLTLLDTRALSDARNAWGSPRVMCWDPPGSKR
ncbi:NPCBM/NEW2 domain-containing protein [Nocardia sp. CA-119907]|uniref:NPCBM/NEW2 domain-containing protein n=1 Tax=Nocardia sp. CA-119907 TaxID=3239973 RepID=UPI003D98ED43